MGVKWAEIEKEMEIFGLVISPKSLDDFKSIRDDFVEFPEVAEEALMFGQFSIYDEKADEYRDIDSSDIEAIFHHWNRVLA